MASLRPRLVFLFGLVIQVLLLGTPSESSTNSNGYSRQLPPFGRAMRDEFQFDPNFIYLDHGAYGTHPKAVRDGLHAYQARAEANPDLWIRREAKEEMAKIRSQLAALVNVDADDIVVVPNTTSGMNAILRSMVFAFGERILKFSTIYNSMGSIIQYICDYSEGNVTSVQFNVTYPISNDQLVEDFELFLNETHDPTRPIKLALMDHITSTPGVILPIERLIPLLKARDILVLIDGAHAIGQIPLDIAALQPDYYITNAHKWLYAARGAALLYVDKEHQGSVHPAHINSGYAQPGKFQDEFFWTGTMDYSPYMTITAALEFRRAVGGEAVIQQYTHQLAVDGGDYLASTWNTSVLQEDDQMGSMVDVQLPIDDPDNPSLNSDFWIDTLLYGGYPVYASPYKHNGRWWVRVSAQIYNDLEDFKTAGETFATICNKINANDTTTPATTTTTPATTVAATTIGTTITAATTTAATTTAATNMSAQMHSNLWILAFTLLSVGVVFREV